VNRYSKFFHRKISDENVFIMMLHRYTISIQNTVCEFVNVNRRQSMKRPQTLTASLVQVDVHLSTGASICGEDWRAQLLFSTLLFSFVYAPSQPGGQGERCKLHQRRSAVSSPNGVWGGAPAESTALPQKSDILW